MSDGNSIKRMPIEKGTVHWRQILKFCNLRRIRSIKKEQNKLWNENSVINVSRKPQLSDGTDRNWHFWMWDIFTSDFIENKEIAIIKGGFTLQ